VRAMRHMDVSMVAPFFNLGTAFTAIFAFIIFRESLNLIDVVGIALLIAGGYFLELKGKNPLQPIRDTLKSNSIHYLLGGVLLFSSGYLLAKYILESVEPVPFFFYQQAGALVVYLLITVFVYKGAKDILSGFKSGGWMLPVMAILLIMENVLIFEALKYGKASLVVPLYRTWTLWAVIFGGRIMHENHVLKRTLASLLMIIGAAIILIW
jgi:transporter family protein